MCLEVSVSLSKLARSGISPERLAEASGLYIARGVNNLGRCFHLSRSGACSCDLLARGTGQQGITWILDDDMASRVAAAVAFVGKEAGSFTFQATWLGEALHEPQRIKLATLLSAIRENNVPKNTPLFVGSHP